MTTQCINNASAQLCSGMRLRKSLDIDQVDMRGQIPNPGTLKALRHPATYPIRFAQRL